MNVINKVTIEGVTKYIKDTAGQAMIAVEETSTTATAAHAIGSLFRLDGKLYKATSTIAVGDTIVYEGNNANCVETDIDGELIKDVQVNGTSILSNGVANVPEMNANTAGVAKLGTGLQVVGGKLYTYPCGSIYAKSGIAENLVVTPKYQHESVFYGLTKAAGVDMASSSNPVGTYTDAAKTAIKTMIGVQEGLEVVRLI